MESVNRNLHNSDENVLKAQKEEHGKTLVPLEPFLESCLQVRN